MIARILGAIVHMFSPLIALVTLLLGYLETLFQWRSWTWKSHLTPPSSVSRSLWVHEGFSDEEGDCTVSSAGSDLAAPLEDSTSSCSSDQHQQYSLDSSSPLNGDAKGRSLGKPAARPPLRRPNTSPGPRARLRSYDTRSPRIMTRTGMRSPQKRLFADNFDSSPTQQSFNKGAEAEEGEEGEEQMSLQPHSL